MVALQRQTGVAWRQLGATVLCARFGDVDHDLTGAAALAWVALDEPRTRDQLVAELGEFGADAAQIDEALRLLADENLIEPV